MNKKRNVNNNDIYESKWEVFLRNYKNVPGFKALVKLGIYFLFFLTFILIVNIGGKELDSNNKTTTTTTTTESITYKDILVSLANEYKNIEFISTINNYKTKITANSKEKIIEGIIENQEGMKKFIIRDDQVYEVLLDTETINENLFNNINIDFLIPSRLVELLTSNHATKRKIDDKTIIYNYNITYNEINYDTIVTVKENQVISVTLQNDNNIYEINYR